MTNARRIAVVFYVVLGLAALTRLKAPAEWWTPLLLVQLVALAFAVYFSVRGDQKDTHTVLQVFSYLLTAFTLVPLASTVIAIRAGAFGPILSSGAGVVLIGGAALYLRRRSQMHRG